MRGLILLANQLGIATLLAQATSQLGPSPVLGEGFDPLGHPTGYGCSVGPSHKSAGSLTCSLVRGLILLATQLGMAALLAQATSHLDPSPVLGEGFDSPGHTQLAMAAAFNI